jgi:sortase A
MGGTLRVGEGLLLAVALVSFAYVAAAHLGASREQARLARELEQKVERIQGASAANRAPRRIAPAAGALVGRLEVPRLGMSAIAREGADAKTLRRAVGHVPDTALPGERGNAAFAGHRDTFFRKLQHVRTGDEIIITTGEGRYEYVVHEIQVVKPRDVWVLDPTADPTLTLVTCHPFNYIGSAPNRFIVRATLAERRAARQPALPVSRSTSKSR